MNESLDHTTPLSELPPPPDSASMDAYLEHQQQIVEGSHRDETEAIAVKERMDHLDDHYRYIGLVALGQPTADFEGDPGGRTFFERRRDRIAERKGLKLAEKRIYAARDAGNIALLQGMTEKEKSTEIRSIRKQSKAEHWTARQTDLAILKVEGTTTVPQRNEKSLKWAKRKVKLTELYNSASVRSNRNSKRRNRKRDAATERINAAQAAALEAQRNIDALTNNDEDD